MQWEFGVEADVRSTPPARRGGTCVTGKSPVALEFLHPSMDLNWSNARRLTKTALGTPSPPHSLER